MKQVLTIFTFTFLSFTTSVWGQNPEIEYYANGKKKMEEDKKNNRWKEWFEDGTLRIDKQILSLNSYDYVKANNKEWYSNGKLKSETKCNDAGDVCYELEYYENGQLKSINSLLVILDDTTRDVRFVYTKSFWDNGQLNSEGPVGLLGEYKYRSYFRNGAVSSTYSKIFGLANGLSIEYYENGDIKEEGLFENDVKVGVWHYFEQNGKLRREETWEDGILKSEKNY